MLLLLLHKKYPCPILIQAETSEDLFEWKAALEEALAQAPNAALVMGHNGIFRNDTTDVYEGAIPNCWCPTSLTVYTIMWRT